MITKTLRFKIEGTENRWKGVVAPISYERQDGVSVTSEVFKAVQKQCEELRANS